MTRIFIYLILISLAVFPALAQNPALYQGANLTLTEGATLYVQGDFQNASGSTFDNHGSVKITGDLLQEGDAPLFTNGGMVEFSGTERQTIGGTGTGTVNLDSLIVNNPDTVELARDGVSVAEGLRLQSGILYLNENRSLDLGSTGQLVNEQESSRVTGSGNLTAQADLSAPSSANPGNLGLLISSSQNLGSTTVSRTHTATGPEDNSIFRSYTVNPSNNQNLDASLHFQYFDAELNGLTESSLAPFTSEDGSTWMQQPITAQSIGENYVEFGNLSSLNLTTLSEGQPLPVADAGTDQEICAGISVPIGGSPSASDGTEPYTYSWSPAEGLDDATLANPTATPTTTTTYILLVTDANGNTDEDAVTVTVNALPTVTFNAVDPQCVNGDATDLTSFVSPAGGSFSGTGIRGDNFDPAVAGVGTHTITYSYTDGNTCENSATVDIVVNDLPAVTFDPVAPQCIDAEAVDLSGFVSPAGGSFSGNGISDNSFDPAVAGVGTHTITYSYTDGNSCENSATVDIVVNDLPAVTFDPVDPQCVDSDAIDLSGLVSPAGGSFSGNGISDSSFDPAVAGAGTHTIIYSYTDGNSCENSASVDIVVNDLPTLNFAAVGPFCIDAEAVDLSSFVSPAGGSFSGAGMSGSTFDPAVAGAGTHTITYSYTDGNGCENNASLGIVVNDLPTLSFAAIGPYCVNGDAVDLSNLVTPTGGSFSGTGISGSSFDPATAGVGTHTIIYAYTDGNGCENSATVDIVVNDLPTVTFDPVDMLFVGDDPVDLSGFVSPFGGSFYGAGISGNTFDPTIAGEGTHTITYSYTDGNGCENTTSIDIEVAAVQLSVLHLNADGQPNNNTIKPYLQFDNEGDHPVPYSKITLRYWLTVEDFSPMTNLSVYWAQLGTNKVHMSYVALVEPRQGALGYVEYSFDASAGELGAGNSSGPIQNGVAKQNWTNFDETDDYSYATTTTYTPNEQITAYYNGYLVWGTEPPVIPTLQSLKVYSETKNPSKTNTISTYVQVRNEGNVPVSYQDLTVRYWFTADGEAAVNFYLDYAVLGNANVNGQIVQLPTPVAGADRYLELSFAASLGSFNPGSNTGNIQYRMAKSNWSKFDQSDDYSYVPKGPMSENVNMTVYLDGELIYGTEPTGANARLLSATATKTSDAALEFSQQGTLAGELQWKVYPNPVAEELFVQLESAVAEEATVRVYDLMGRLLLERKENLQAGSNQIHLAEVSRWAGHANQMVLRLQTPTLGVRQVKLLRP